MIRDRHLLKGENELKAMIEDVVSDKVTIETMQWMKIIERMYDVQDIRILEEKIKENAKIRMKLEISKKLHRKTLSPSASQHQTLGASSSGKHSSRGIGSNIRMTREE